MDMAFLRRAEQMLGDRQPVRLDHALLVAALTAQQTASASARRCEAPGRSADGASDDPLTELLLAGPGWRRAASQQCGCFSRAEAGRRINAR